MNRFLRLFVILVALGVMAASCQTSPDPAVPERTAEFASADTTAEAGDEDAQDYVDEGTKPDELLLQSMMQFRELGRVEAEFGSPEWNEAKLYNYEDVQFVLVPIVSIRQDEFHCLVVSAAENDFLIFVMSAEAGSAIPADGIAAQSDMDDVMSLAGSMTFVHGPGMDDLLFVTIDDSFENRVSSASSRAKCVYRCFKRYPLTGISRCVSLARACLTWPYPLNIPICAAAAYCIYKYYRKTIGPLIKCVCACFGWHTHALRPIKH